MNILFANYGDFTSNSLNHIAAFANELSALGHHCIVAVPNNKESIHVLDQCHFQAAEYSEVLNTPDHFPNGQPADILHAWTPREYTRLFVQNYCQLHKTKVIVHLEDNEEHITESYYGTPINELYNSELPPGFTEWISALSHPRHWRPFLALADGTTAIIEDLFEFTSNRCPQRELLPGLDPNAFSKDFDSHNKRDALKISPNEHLIVYPGGVTSSNREDIRSLYRAIKILNDAGYRTKLVKTGPIDPSFNQSFDFDPESFVIDLGFVNRSEIPQLIACADVLVQPGKADDFNRYRLPSKLPEFLASGRPVITPETNIGLRLYDGENCLKLHTGKPEEIAQQCIRIFNDPELAQKLGNEGQNFARHNFTIAEKTSTLLQFYEKIHSSGSNNWACLKGSEADMRLVVTQKLNELISKNDRDASDKKSIQCLNQFLENHNQHFPQLNSQDTDNPKDSDDTQAQHHSQELRREKEQRDQSIRRLKNTFSWKVTMPLRALRRAFIDPFTRKPITETTPVETAPNPIEAIAPNPTPIPSTPISEPDSITPAPVEAPPIEEPPTGEPLADRDYAALVSKQAPLVAEYIKNFQVRNPNETQQPFISIILPVYNVDDIWLIKAIDSVRNQIYTNWELCIADDASPRPHIRPLLESYQSKDKRIKVVFREKNGHISNASNSAIEIAQGEFIALLDHDDEIPPHALARIVDAIRATPDANIVYTDEDKIDEDGQRGHPHFKSDWNPDLLNGQNFVSHFGTYRRSVVESVGRFRTGYEGAQDWDLALRVSEQSRPDQILHVPEVLYHWRMIAGSTATNITEKDYAHTIAGKVLQNHFDRIGQPINLLPIGNAYWRSAYPVPTPQPKVSIIIPSRDRIDILRPCIQSIQEKTTYKNYEIVIVDNETTDTETLQYLEDIQSDQVRVERHPGPFNFAALNNTAVRNSTAQIICLLNNDITVITPEWLDELVSHASRPEIGIAGAKLYYPHDHIQHSGIVMGLGGIAGEAFKKLHRSHDGYIHRAFLVSNFSAVTGACFVFKKTLWEEIDGLREEDIPNAFGDVDFCLRAKAAGYRTLFTPFAELYHHESCSRGNDMVPEKVEAFKKAISYMENNWASVIHRDPYYNPNLTLKRQDFTFTFPPRGYTTK